MRVTDRNVWRWGLKVGPEGTLMWYYRDTVLSQMGMLRLMQAGCGAWVWVVLVAGDLLRLFIWGLGVSVSEASLHQISWGGSTRVQVILLEAVCIKYLCQNHPLWVLSSPGLLLLTEFEIAWALHSRPLPREGLSLKSCPLRGPSAPVCWLWDLLWISTFTTQCLTTTKHAALEAASGCLGNIRKSSWRRWTGSPKGRTWCLLSPSPTLLASVVFTSWNTYARCLHLCPRAEHVCVYTRVLIYAGCDCVCVCVCVWVCPAQGRGRDEGGRRGGAEQPEEESWGDQAEGGLSPHLCIDPAQDGNKERMASDNSRLWLQISAIRPDTKHAHQFYRVVVCAWIRKRVSWSKDSHRANHVGWGFETTACGALRVWGHGLASGNEGRGYGKIWDGEAKVLPRWAESWRRKSHRLPAALEIVPHTCEKENWEGPGPVLPRSAQQPAHALPEGGTHWHNMTQNMRCTKVCCICQPQAS